LGVFVFAGADHSRDESTRRSGNEKPMPAAALMQLDANACTASSLLIIPAFS
jgi:hypothetical protein